MMWFHGSSGSRAAGRPIDRRSIAVLVDLELADHAGGHVKCWQRIAEASGHFTELMDLTVYFLGERESIVEIGANARYVTLPPCLGTRRFGFLAQGAGHTDLAPFHPRLARLLCWHDTFHATDVFAFAQTARRVARWQGKPFVTSLHTDLPQFTEIYTAEIVQRHLGSGPLARVLLEDIRLGTRSAAAMRRKVDAMMHQSDRVMVSNAKDWRQASRIVGGSHVSFLRRGIDSDRFHPDRRDRARLAARFGIPEDCTVLLFVGRIDATKKALFAAEAAAALIGLGHRLRFVAIGDGVERGAIARLLGAAAILPGTLPQEELGWIYPSADIFVFPSESDIAGNVVLEAKASGLPVVVANHPGPAQFIGCSGKDGIVVPAPKIAAWRDALEPLVADETLRRGIGINARQSIETSGPTWRDVVGDDLLPVWRTVAPRRAADGRMRPAPSLQWPAE
jgi:glycosyltransferase involved in cell wall biosynthesis